ncbi:hypothetical protein [Mycobacteroides chelonae]|nr:hypothetical protein [Mycobacteroides chelonae]
MTMSDPVDWDKVHDGEATEEDWWRWAEEEGDWDEEDEKKAQK